MLKNLGVKLGILVPEPEVSSSANPAPAALPTASIEAAKDAPPLRPESGNCTVQSETDRLLRKITEVYQISRPAELIVLDFYKYYNQLDLISDPVVRTRQAAAMARPTDISMEEFVGMMKQMVLNSSMSAQEVQSAKDIKFKLQGDLKKSEILNISSEVDSLTNQINELTAKRDQHLQALTELEKALEDTNVNLGVEKQVAQQAWKAFQNVFVEAGEILQSNKGS